MSDHILSPGSFILDELDARGWSQADLAFVLGKSTQSINALVKGKRGISPETAKSVGEAFGISAEVFLNIQKMYELSRANPPSAEIRKKAKLQSAYPIREMIRRQWLDDGESEYLEEQICRFFDVDSVHDVPHLSHHGKKTDYRDIPPVQLAWLFRVKRISEQMSVAHFSKKSYDQCISTLKSLTKDHNQAAQVPAILNDCGIKFVIVEALPGSKIDGVCFWESKKVPVIGMSLRHDRIDNFWFVLRHELEHVVQTHAKDAEMVDVEMRYAENEPGLPPQEVQANEAAADFCVPTDDFENFCSVHEGFISESDIVEFANRMEVHPGLVAGRLQWKLGKYNYWRKLLPKIRSIVLSTAVYDGWGKAIHIDL